MTCRVVPDFMKPQTYEFRLRNKDGTWDDDWWTCSDVFAEVFQEEIDKAGANADVELRKIAPPAPPR